MFNLLLMHKTNNITLYNLLREAGKISWPLLINCDSKINKL